MRTYLLLAVTLSSLPALASEPLQSAFGPGEQSVFEVSYLGVPTGTVVITVGQQDGGASATEGT